MMPLFVSWDEEGWGVAESVAAGVRDEPLLRVAAGVLLGALHAVREHDSLLRGSEPALPEHERAAAWQQFQLKHVHPANPSAIMTKKEKFAFEDKASTSSDFASTSTTSSKIKKGNNSQTTKEKASTPSEEATPDLLSPDKDEMLVKKIMQILIENNFHETILAQELTKLIVNVRRLVSSRMGDDGLLKDPIAAGIASVLLQNDADSGYTVPDEQIVEDTAPIPVEKNDVKEDVQVATTKSFRQSDSILISDDGDVEPITEPPPLVPITKKQKIKEKVIEKQNVPDKKEEKKVEEERVPLHPLILSNDDFIKIVAHTYQRGNLMLSDDAAKIAAQYSTNKARSEYEATGVPIVSGPLYEIAIESFGLETLKGVHESTKTKFDKPPQPSITITNKNNDDVHVAEADVEKKEKKKKFVGPKSRKRLVEPSPSPPPLVEINQAIVPEPLPQNVFPVGMFKDPVEVAKSQPPQVVEECILPDDDEEDVVIISVVHRPARILTPPANNETESRALSRKNSYFIDNTLPSQTLSTDTIPKQITPNLPTQSKAHKQIKPVTKKQTITPPKLITQNVAAPSKPPHIQITPNLATQSTPTSVRVLTIDKGTPIIPQSTAPAANITSQVTPGNEQICLSDSDDEIVPYPVGINNPSKSLEPVTVTQPPPKNATKSAPIIVQSASFKGGTPFVLSNKVKKMLHPNKKSHFIPVNGVPQCQSNSEVTPHVIISPSTPTKDSVSHDQYTKKDNSKKSGKIEVTATEVFSANDLKSLPTQTATNKIVANANNQMMSQPSTSNIYSRNSSKPNVVPQANHRKRSYKELPKVQITKTEAKPNVIKILKDDLPKPKSVANTSRDRPVMISNPSSTIQTKGSPARKKLLVILKKIQYDNINESSSSPKVINVEREAAKKLTASSFIDLADIPERKPKVENRPAPYVDKSAKKQKKLLTLEDFSLDDFDDI
ncbi:unnamed protein product [Colias eurytheme]|nr:unnamed protein product [Colias eurytheme]